MACFRSTRQDKGMKFKAISPIHYTYTQKTSWRKKTGEIKMYTILIYWKWVVRCLITLCKLPILLLIWLSLGSCAEVPCLLMTVRKTKKPKKKLFLHLILLFKSIFSSASKGTDSQVVGIKTRWVVGQGPGGDDSHTDLDVFVQCIFSVVIHTFTFNSSVKKRGEITSYISTIHI